MPRRTATKGEFTGQIGTGCERGDAVFVVEVADAAERKAFYYPSYWLAQPAGAQPSTIHIE